MGMIGQQQRPQSCRRECCERHRRKGSDFCGDDCRLIFEAVNDLPRALPGAQPETAKAAVREAFPWLDARSRDAS